MKLPELLPSCIDWDVLDLDDLQVQKAIKTILDEVHYNSRLVEALARAYDWQWEAIALTKDNKVVGSVCGNQMGKTENNCAAVACHATGMYPKKWKGRKSSKPVKIMVAGVDSNFNKNVLQERLFGTNNKRLKKEIGKGMIPRDSIIMESMVTVRGDDIASCKIKHSSGGMSEIMFKSYSQGREAAQGFPADIIMIDEQPDDEFWAEALTRTVATGGHVICSFTPLKGRTGLVDTLMSLEDVKDSPFDKFGAKYKQEDGWAMVRASWDDQTHISDKDQKEAIKGYAAYERDARVYGMPIAGHGRIYPYEESQVVYDPREVNIETSWNHLIGIDIGHGHGGDDSACILVAYDEENKTIYVTDEAVGQTDTTREMAKLITRVNHIVPVAWPSDANKTDMRSQSTVAEELREMQVNLLGKPFINPKGADGKRNNWKATGINYINSMFSDGKLRISANCVCLIDELLQYQYDKNGKIQDGNDHALDAFRYAIMSLVQDLGAPMNDRDAFYDEDDDDDYTFNSY